jgi:hypothetical protein
MSEAFNTNIPNNMAIIEVLDDIEAANDRKLVVLTQEPTLRPITAKLTIM